jgi:acylphosphatase
VNATGGDGESAGRDDVVGVEIVVEGAVQGVGFRQFAWDCAERLGVVGYAMNVPDGTVRVVAEGARAALEAFVAQLERGPRLGRVARVDVAWRAARGEFTGFGIRYHGHGA